MIPRIPTLPNRTAFRNCRFTVMVRIFSVWLFIQLANAGRPNEDRMSLRIRDDPSLGAIEPQLDEAPSGDRSRRQLPTEINIQVTAPLFTARLYDFGLNDGDKEVPPSIDVGIKYELKQPLTFFAQQFNEIYILSNGGIGFEANSRNFKSDVFHGGPVLIAPLWNRNDLRKGGKIFYREVTEGRAIERAQSEVRYQYDKVIKPVSVLLVTWVHMQPMGEQNLSEDNSNTFQAAIISSDNGTFANFIFKSIGWTQGAEAGFSKGDNKNFYGLPTSGTSNIMYLKEYGNTGIPGEWMFEIGESTIIRCKPGVKGDTCDDECAEYEWGNDCEKCCHCGKGRCNVNTGECAGECKQCWKNAPHCDKREGECRVKAKECGYNAISFTDYDRCGEAVVRCQCLSGYVGDGYNCTDVDECSKPDTCSPAATCYNTPGRHYCECQSGFTGNGTVCLPSSGGGGGGVGGGLGIISSLNRSSPLPAIDATVAETASNTTPSSATPTPIPPASALPSVPTIAAEPTPPSSSVGTSLPLSETTASSVSTIPLSPTPGLGLHLITGSTASTATSQHQLQETPEPATIAVQTQSATIAPQAQPEEATKPPPKTQYPDAVQSLPKETFSQITYRMRQPVNVFGKRRDHLTVSSTGLISLDDVPPVTPDDELDQLGISGFAPFFGKIDLGQNRAGAVTVRETSHSFVLTEATSLIDNYFHNPGFMAKSVLTISFDNVTTPANQQKNNFQVVLIGGQNALGENITFVEYIYSNIQWSEGAQAMIIADDSSNSVQLPGSGSDGVRQLSQLTNIGEPGQWLYRVDLERITCPQSNLLPPYCTSETPAPTTSASRTSGVLINVGTLAVSGNLTGVTGGFAVASAGIDVGLHASNNSVRPGITPAISFTDFEDETITFQAFVTLQPQLITQITPTPPLQQVPSASLAPVGRPDAASATPAVEQLPAGVLPEITDSGPPQPPASAGDNPLIPRPPSLRLPNAHPVSIAALAPTAPPTNVVNGTGSALPAEQEPSFEGNTSSVPVEGPLGPPVSAVPPQVPFGPTLAITVPVAPANPPLPSVFPVGPPTPAAPILTQPQLQAPVPSNGTVAPPPPILSGGVPDQVALPTPPITNISVDGPAITPVNTTPGWQPPPSNESQQFVPTVQFAIASNAPVANGNIGEDTTSNLPPLQIFTSPPRRQTRPPVPTRPQPRIVTATTPPFGPYDGGPRRGPPNGNNNNLQNVAADSEELDSLNSPSKLAIIIPTAIVGVWLLLLMVIGIVVCCKRRSNRRRMRNKYDPGYHFRHMPSIAAAPRGKDTAAVAAAAAAAGPQTSYPQPHVSYEDHLEKAARLSEMSQYGQNGGRVSMYGSYWNVPNSSRQYSYYNQGYYESCPEFNRTNYYNGRY